MRGLGVFIAALLLAGAAPEDALAGDGPRALVVTSSNQTVNQLLVYDDAGTLLQAIATQGQGGASSNGGGIAVRGATVAVVNFGSGSVSIFSREGDSFALADVIPALSAPVSVVFGKDHLYILGIGTVESHRFDGGAVGAAIDGSAPLVRADGSAAQVGVAGDQLIVAEKSNVVELFPLRGGAVSGAASVVPLPAGSDDTPFGLVTRGASAYVTIAHSDQVALIKGGRVLATAATGTPGGTGQHSPCWAALAGPYLYTTNSPSSSISRLIATGANVILDDPIAFATIGAPTDIAGTDRIVAVIDSSNGVSRLTQFAVDEAGGLTPTSQTSIAAPINGIGIVNN